MHPSEPLEPPPVPAEIVQLLVMGEHQSGKTSLSKRFLRRHCLHAPEKPSNKRTKPSEWSVEYHKKDVSFWLSNSESVGSARVQVWDATGGGPSDQTLERRHEWIRLVEKMTAVLLVVSLEHGPDVLFDNIRLWKDWLDECSPNLPPVYLFLQKSDLLPHQAVEPSFWIHFGSRVARLCDEMGIADWHLTSCREGKRETEHSSPEDVIMDLLQGYMASKAPRKKDPYKARQVGSSVGKSRVPGTKALCPEFTEAVLEAEAVPIM